MRLDARTTPESLHGAGGTTAFVAKRVALLLAALWSTAAAATPSLQMAGPTQDGSSVIVSALSADGSTVASRSLVPIVIEGVRTWQTTSHLWTREDGLRTLDATGPHAPDPLTFVPHALSGDGSKVVGSQDGRPVLWERGVGTTVLAGLAAGTEGGTAHGISADGRYIVGTYHDGGTYESARLTTLGTYVIDVLPSRVPVRWDTMDGSLEALSTTRGLAYDVSNDGVAVGTIELLEESAFPSVAYRWDETRGLQLVPNTLDVSLGEPIADVGGISDDGTTIVGQNFASLGIPGLPELAFPGYLWQGDPGNGDTLPLDGMSLILPPRPEDLPFRIHVEANAVSSDGSTVVGGYRSVDAAGRIVPFVWTREAGLRDLGALLESMGVSTEQWDLYEATAVSADGRTIIGHGRFVDERGRRRETVWIAVIPEPSTALLLGGGLAGLAARRKSLQSAPTALRHGTRAC